MYYFTNLDIYYRSQWLTVVSLTLLVSVERRKRRHTGDVLLFCRVGLNFVLVWISKKQWWLMAGPQIHLPSNTMQIHQKGLHDCKVCECK